MSEHTALLCYLQAASLRKGGDPARFSTWRTSLLQI